MLMQVRWCEFAFEGSDGLLAWRRWPPAGTPAWQAAAERLEAARRRAKGGLTAMCEGLNSGGWGCARMAALTHAFHATAWSTLLGPACQYVMASRA